jgi:membrane protein YqaA with SNARE-associated domain
MDFVQFLQTLANNPVDYTIILFVYALLAALILPIPVELVLFIPTPIGILGTAFVLALGKTTGAMIVFYLGIKVEKTIMMWSNKFKWIGKFFELLERFVVYTQYIGLYILLSIPLMPDTVTIYFFSLFNRDEVMKPRYFAITNFCAGVNRAMIVYALASLFGITLVSG